MSALGNGRRVVGMRCRECATEYPVQRYLRDSRFLLFGGGTSEILRLIIARGL